jgi:hypothetical protein
MDTPRNLTFFCQRLKKSLRHSPDPMLVMNEALLGDARSIEAKPLELGLKQYC